MIRRSAKPVPPKIVAHVSALLDALSDERPDYETARLAALAAYEELLAHFVRGIYVPKKRREDRRGVTPTPPTFERRPEWYSAEEYFRAPNP